MFLRLLFLLTFIPFIELYFLVKLSDSMGFGNTVLLVLLTGVLGAALLRRQGHSIIMEIQKKTAENQIPSDAISKGFFTFIGGVLLLTPGILTDAIGLSLIFPPTQYFWKKYFIQQWERGIKSGHIHVHSNMRTPSGDSGFDIFNQKPNRDVNYSSAVIDIEAHSETVSKDENSD